MLGRINSLKHMTPLDRAILQECRELLQDVLRRGGAACALSYLKEHVLVSPFAKSQLFLNEVSRFKVVKELLSKASPEEAEEIRQILNKGGEQ